MPTLDLPSLFFPVSCALILANPQSEIVSFCVVSSAPINSLTRCCLSPPTCCLLTAAHCLLPVRLCMCLLPLSSLHSVRLIPVQLGHADCPTTKPVVLLFHDRVVMAMHRPSMQQSPPRSDSPPTAGSAVAGIGSGGGSAAVAASSASSSSSAAAPPLLSSRGSSDQHQSLSSGQKENIAIMATAAAAASSPVMANATPKPPKKRYLENSEFRGNTIA